MYIISMGSAHPEGRFDNAFLEEINPECSAQWIHEKIGIESRATSLPLDYIRETLNKEPQLAPSVATASATTLGVEAARMAIERAGLLPGQIGLVICNTCRPDYCFPTQGQRIADALGVVGPSYDVMSACPAFALHMDYLHRFRMEELPEYCLCISTAALTQNVDFRDRTDSAIWGDGAAAWIVSPRTAGKLKVLETFFDADPLRAAAVVVDRFGFFHQDGRAVRDFSVRQTVRLVKRLEAMFPIDWSRDVFIGHQANRTMLEQIVRNRGIPEQSHWHNVTYLGNQAGAGAPAVLSERWSSMVVGQRIVVAVVGAGLSWGSVLLEVQE
jgi:3-oxoacyl-[acyl-carrier-protein] synthase III